MTAHGDSVLAPEEEAAARTGNRVLAVCLVVGFATLVDQSILTVALPAVRESLGASTSQVQWIVAAYSLGFAITLVPAGRLGDARGRRRLLVGGVASFSLLSVVAATARSADVVVVCRLLQGFAAGTANPQVIGLIQDHFAGWRRTRALGAYATVATFAGILAPLLGGAVVALVGGAGAWRWVAAVNVPFGIAAAVLGVLWLPRVARRPGRASLDVPGAVLLGAATLAVLLPAVALSGGGSASWWSLPVLAVVVTTLVAWERRFARRGGTPIVLPALLTDRSFALGTLVATFAFGAMLGTSLVLVLFLQEGLGLSAWHAGLVGTPGAVVGAGSSLLAWRVAARHGRPAVTAALGLVAVSLVGSAALVAWAPAQTVVAGLVAAQVLSGAGSGLVHAPNQSLTLQGVPPGTAGLAAGFLQVAQRISAVLSLAVLGGVVLASVEPGDVTGYRRASAIALAVTAALVGAAVAASLADRCPHSTLVLSPAAPDPRPAKTLEPTGARP
ncbi:MFS transporter [Cellulomonas edaphi]|uniref:MFS transporter n=1 Tax=Cellulomonas edaphi TaxID=3053468 RepID=A0ABT7S9N7_9CELL|nr:MFS transporter [Cellulomons edaphi]MDM7831664.1 MFS transporter [Cellulomons edaphi]